MRTRWILAWGLVILGFVNVSIWQKERLIDEGRRVLLTLSPVDPRSLMQGDYMRLNYVLLDEIDFVPIGVDRLVARNDERGVARLVGLDDGSPLCEDCFVVKLSRHRNRVSLGAESYFFQEGQQALYERATHGELVVDEKGNSVLIGLRDENLVRLEPEDSGR